MVRAIALGCVALFLGASSHAYACSWSRLTPGSAEAIRADREWIDEIAASLTIFLAKVVADRSAELGEISLAARPGWFSAPGRRVWFETQEVLKGQIEPRPSVLMGAYGNTCGQGMTVSPGETVLVFVGKHDEFWEGSMAPASNAPKVRARLRQRSKATTATPR
jgi:hypothetical protein